MTSGFFRPLRGHVENLTCGDGVGESQARKLIGYLKLIGSASVVVHFVVAKVNRFLQNLLEPQMFPIANILTWPSRMGASLRRAEYYFRAYFGEAGAREGLGPGVVNASVWLCIWGNMTD